MKANNSFLRIPTEDLEFIVNSIGLSWESLRGQRLLLTGGTGFIGKWILASFLLANRKLGLCSTITVISRDSEAFLNEFPELRLASEITWCVGDVRDLEPDSIGDNNFAIHAATDVVASKTPTETLDTCVTGTKRVLEAITKNRSTCRILILSSGAVYGRTPSNMRAIPEDWAGAPDTLNPKSYYGEGKRMSELLGAMASQEFSGLEVVIARCFAFVGPHLPLDKHFAIGNFIKAAIQNEDIHISGDGTPRRSYLYVSDLVYWLWKMLFDAPSGRVYNVGGAESISIGELAKRVNLVLNGSGEVRIAQLPPTENSPQVYVPAIGRIGLEMNLRPTVDLDEAIRKTAHWARQYL